MLARTRERLFGGRGGKLWLAAGFCMPCSVTGLAGNVLAALDEFVRKAAIFFTGEFAFVVGLA